MMNVLISSNINIIFECARAELELGRTRAAAGSSVASLI
jgi:hypothetical protein